MEAQVVETKKSIFAKLCRCIAWETKSHLNGANVNTLKWKGFKQKTESQSFTSIVTLLIDLYNGKDVYEILETCRINPDFTSKHAIRNDLEYYIPQLTNLMIFHRDMSNEKLDQFLENLSKTDPYFSHLFYWYLNSLSSAFDEEKGKKIVNNILTTCSKQAKTQVFIRDYERFYWNIEQQLDKEGYISIIREMQNRQAKMTQYIKQYRLSKDEKMTVDIALKASDLELKPYISPLLEGNKAYFSNSFTSTLLFFEDIYQISNAMMKVDHKLRFLKKSLEKINEALPSSIYIPFVKDSIRYYTILNIVVEETRVFSTKTRAPFCIWIELFKPHTELAYEYNTMFPKQEDETIRKKPKAKALVSWAKKALKKSKKSAYSKMEEEITEKDMDETFKIGQHEQLISTPVSLKQPLELYIMSPIKESENNRSLEKDGFGEEEESSMPELNLNNMERKDSADLRRAERAPASIITQNFPKLELEISRGSQNTSLDKSNEPQVAPSPMSCKLSPFNLVVNMAGYLKNDIDDEKESPEKKKGDKNLLDGKDDIFGEDSKAKCERIKDQSIFRELKTWKLLSVIVKTGADMKEEQFAIQLISQFDQIFRAEKLKLIVTPYEIMSLGQDIGLVEVIQDAVTLSNLKEKMYNKNIPTLNAFFEQYYGKNVEKARKRFCRSLAAYSLICYFLQIKDRHNENIFLHKQGHIIHIDFGFFLTNAPGRGLEFEKRVPFKLLNEYIEVLGGYRSSLFQEFRKLFYKGFMAACKHKEQILILVKMMYSSQGNTLPCFSGGLKAITELEQRFSPPGVSEKDLISFCYNLINQSVDNWRAKCYDKYQYHFQGIFY